MEGRAQPAEEVGRAEPAEEVKAVGDRSDDDESLDPQSLQKENPPSEGCKTKETYVVQMPRDQVYRIPPPEHAKFVEDYRNPPKQKKRRKIPWCCWLLVVVSILGIGIGIFIAVSHSLFQPKSPIFHVTSIQANNLETNKERMPPSFDVVMEVSNPNSGIHASYNNGHNSSLFFKNVRIGGGQFLLVSQDDEKSTSVNLKLDGTKDGSSKDINTALNDTHPKSMILEVDVHIEMQNWINSMSKDTKVTCSFNAKSFGTDKAKILSEACQTDFSLSIT